MKKGIKDIGFSALYDGDEIYSKDNDTEFNVLYEYSIALNRFLQKNINCTSLNFNYHCKKCSTTFFIWFTITNNKITECEILHTLWRDDEIKNKTYNTTNSYESAQDNTQEFLTHESIMSHKIYPKYRKPYDKEYFSISLYKFLMGINRVCFDGDCGDESDNDK